MKPPVLAVRVLPGPHEPAVLLSGDYQPLLQVHQQRVPDERVVSDSKTKDPGNCQVKDPKAPDPLPYQMARLFPGTARGQRVVISAPVSATLERRLKSHTVLDRSWGSGGKAYLHLSV